MADPASEGAVNHQAGQSGIAAGHRGTVLVSGFRQVFSPVSWELVYFTLTPTLSHQGRGGNGVGYIRHIILSML